MGQLSTRGASKSLAFAIFSIDGLFVQRLQGAGRGVVFGPSPVPMGRDMAVQACKAARACGVAAWLIPAEVSA